MFQTHVTSDLFLAAEPGKRKSPESTGSTNDKTKQQKKTTSLQQHLRNIGDMLNIISRKVSNLWSDTEIDLINTVQTLLQEAIDTNVTDNLSIMATIIAEFNLNSGNIRENVEQILTLLNGPLPSQLGATTETGVDDSSDDSPDDSSDDASDPIAASDETRGETKGETICRIRSQPLVVGSRVLVTLIEPAGKQSKVTRLLRDGPRELVLSGIGNGTYGFVVSEKGVKSISTDIEIDRVRVEHIVGVSHPTVLADRMLIEMRWGDDPVYYPVRYVEIGDNRYAIEDLSDPTEDQIYEISEEWQYPTYPQFGYGDNIRVWDDDEFHTADVMDLVDDDHSYICEWNPARSGRPHQQFPLDVWYQQAGAVVEASTVSVSSDEEVVSLDEEEEEAAYVEQEDVTFHGKEYKIASVIETEEGWKYTIIDEDGKTSTVTEDDLDNQWNPSFAVTDTVEETVMYMGEVVTIIAFDYTNRKYVITTESSKVIEVDERDLSYVDGLVYSTGTVVFYNFGYYTIIGENHARHGYELISEDGVVVDFVSEDDLENWVLYIDKNKNPAIYHVVRRFEKTVKRKGGSVKKSFYGTVDISGKKKNIMSSQVNEQRDAQGFFDDAVHDNDGMEERIIFKVGQSVLIYGADSDLVGRVTKHNENSNIDKETYDIAVGGIVSTYSVGTFGLIESEDEDEAEIGDTKEEGGVIWVVTGFKDGKNIWETIDDDDDDSSDDSSDDGVSTDAEFQPDVYVQMGESSEVYVVVSSVANVYVLQSSWDDDAPELTDIDVSNIRVYEPVFEKDVKVSYNGSLQLIAEVHDDGHYILGNGEEVTEDELSEYVDILINGTIVRIRGSKEVYRVKDHQSSGVYVLENMFDKSEKSEVDEDVDVHVEPEYEKDEYVQIEGEEYPCRVKSFNKKNWSYKLVGHTRQFRESELGPPSKDAEYDKGDNVVFGGVVYKIKKVVLERGSYVLENDVEVKEELLEDPDELSEED